MAVCVDWEGFALACYGGAALVEAVSKFWRSFCSLGVLLVFFGEQITFGIHYSSVSSWA